MWLRVLYTHILLPSETFLYLRPSRTGRGYAPVGAAAIARGRGFSGRAIETGGTPRKTTGQGRDTQKLRRLATAYWSWRSL